jgi:CspA family cold shock protein
MKGIVKWFDDKKGYGFITGEDGKEYFVHFTGIVADEGVKFRKLKEDDVVTFDLQPNERGTIAVNVVKQKKEEE